MKSFRSAIILVAAILIAGSAFAQGRGRIDGKIVGPDGQPLADVAVHAKKTGAEETADAKSNPKGEFRLERLSNGEWTLEFHHEGLEAPPAKVTVENNKAPEITVTMGKPDPMVQINNELKRAAELMQGGDSAGARAVYEALYAKYPQPFQFPFAIATTYAAEKNWEKGLEFAKIALEKEPSSVDVKLLIAEIHMESGQRDEARAVLEGIDLKEVNDPLLFINSGIIMINDGQWEQAVALFDRLIERFPAQQNLHYYRGRAHLAGQKLPEAKADFEKFLAASPEAKEAEDAKRIIAEIDKALSGKKDGGQ